MVSGVGFRVSSFRGRLPARERRVGAGGFSLIEVLAAVAIFSIAIVALIEGLAASTRSQAWVEGQSRAIMLAENIMEEIGYMGGLKEGTDGGAFEEEDRGYQWTSEIVESQFEGLFQVQVTIAWAEGNTQRDYQLVTYMRERYRDEFDEARF